MNDFEKLNEKIERKLTLINDAVNERLDKNFEKSNKTFMNVLERLSKIDEAQKKIDGLNSEIVSLQSVLTDKKTRGTFGEVNLEYILNNAFGSNKNGIYDTQHKFSNGYISDAILYAPAPLGTIAIDSKFPLENYQKFIDEDTLEGERLKYEAAFRQDIKKHINDISKKYISTQTVENAVMFIPGEAIYIYICGNCANLIQYAHSKHVLITCPTTLIGVVFTLINITKDFNRSKHIKTLEKDIVAMYEDVTRLTERLDSVDQAIIRAQKLFKDVRISAEKIGKRIIKIHDGYEPETTDDSNQ